MNYYWRIYCGALLTAFSMAAQPVSAGIEIGLPLTTVAQSPACVGCGASDINRYGLGLTGEVRLYRRFSFEVGGLLQRVHNDYHVFVPHFPVGTEGRISGYGYEFPLLLKYTVRLPGLAPFVDAGATIRHVGHLSGHGNAYALPDPSIPMPVQIGLDPYKPVGVGIPIGAGVAVKAGPFHIAPEIRYTRWTEGLYQPTKNEVQLFVGIVFP